MDKFITEYLPDPLQGERRILYREARIEGAQPDLIAVYWNPQVAETWNKERKNLEALDLRILQFLYFRPKHTEKYLSRFFPRGLAKGLERLERAGMITKEGRSWIAISLAENFAVREIISFEAKLSSISRAINQAYANTWFSTQAYIVVPTQAPTTRILSYAKRRGVGIWSLNSNDPSRPLLDAKAHTQPTSYVAWKLNNSIYNYIHNGANLGTGFSLA